MSRLAAAFAGKKPFIAFLTGGDPSLADTRRYVRALVDAGAGIVEIGVPFSDPIAEGPVIQEASQRALAAGTTTDNLFELVAALRDADGITVPLAFMTYLNPVYHYGYERFFAAAAAVGLDAIIIPDLPYEEQGEVKAVAAAHGVAVISLIAPTSAARVRMIAAEAEGFIYLVSSLGVTGTRAEITTDIAAIVSEIRAVTDTPVAVGFGINTPEQAADLAATADGVIVGSAIVKLIAAHGAAADDAIAAYVTQMSSALS
ncbi:MAG: tryptophan synthase subunit alpha [Propionibacteriaceae bacterium]|jgi:tryptophan synthase alpha chain|nr:tryptophan synthase subunit alpha [Propionibacteriaceae bacterium]